MHKDTGEIRETKEIPIVDRNQWSAPFHVGDVVKLFGVKMKIMKVKKLRGELILRHISR